MPAPTMLFAIGVELIIVDILRIMKVPAPCRISSLPQGAPLRPGIYAYIEDICAVDGSGGTQFRQRLNLRYQASKAFREMLHRLTLFWAIGAIVCSVVCTAIIFTIQRDAAYVVSSPSHTPYPSTVTNYIPGRLGPPLPLGRCLGRHDHPLGPETTRQRIRRVDNSEFQSLSFPSLFSCLNLYYYLPDLFFHWDPRRDTHTPAHRRFTSYSFLFTLDKAGERKCCFDNVMT
jgi:hypothetical protein